MTSSDRDRLRDIAEAYFFGVDAVDRGIIAACFHADVRAVLHLGTAQQQELNGREALVDRILRGCSRFEASTHALANLWVEVAGPEARMSIHAIATVVVRGTVQVRGLRYDDRLACRGGVWGIVERLHIPKWQYEAEAKLPELRRG